MNVSIPFREDLYSDWRFPILHWTFRWPSFHPFQGRPLFGHADDGLLSSITFRLFPSLSGKTSIRTSYVYSDSAEDITGFPSLSGKTSIRTRIRQNCDQKRRQIVSIPFREDLYSDFYLSCFTSVLDREVSIPFREDLYSDFYLSCFTSVLDREVSIPFREDLYSDHAN